MGMIYSQQVHTDACAYTHTHMHMYTSGRIEAAIKR